MGGIVTFNGVAQFTIRHVNIQRDKLQEKGKRVLWY